MADPIPITPGRQESVDIYAQAVARLKGVVFGEDITEATKRQAAHKIIAIQEHIKDLKKTNAKWAKRYIPQSYEAGIGQDDALLRRFLGNEYTAGFTKLHRDAARVAAVGAASDFNVTADALENTYVNYVRRVQAGVSKKEIARKIAGGIVEGQTRATTSNMLLDDLRKRAINGTITVGKVTMKATAYADLLSRTLTRTVRTEGTINRLNEYDIDLVIISNTGAVDFCTQYEDQIFSISGNSRKYPMLAARPPYHPHCYSKDTEVYTDNGWKLFKDVKRNDLCWSLDPETKKTEYVPIKRYYSGYSEVMVHFNNNDNIDLLVTPNHKMVYVDRYGEEDKIFFEQASIMMIWKPGSTHYWLCVTPEWDDGESFALISGQDIKTTDYNDMVYCVELEKYHTLFVRRNGKTCWSGNCTHTLAAFVEEFASEKEIEKGQQFKKEDVGKSASEMNKKYPIAKDDTRARTKKTQKAPETPKPVVPAPEPAFVPAKTTEKLEKTMVSGDIQSSIEVEEGKNNVKRVKIKGNGEGAFKSMAGEAGFGTGEKMYIRERAAYLISEEAGLEDVPVTVIRKIKGEIGSLQHWSTTGTLPIDIKPKTFFTDKTRSLYKYEKDKMAFFDSLIGNSDRHAGNYLIKKSGKITYIDNGSSLGVSSIGYPDSLIRSTIQNLYKNMPGDIATRKVPELTRLRDGIKKITTKKFGEILIKNSLEREALGHLQGRARTAIAELDKILSLE